MGDWCGQMKLPLKTLSINIQLWKGKSMIKVSAVVAGLTMLFNVQTVIAVDAPVMVGGVEMPQVESSEAFEQIKKKLGKW